MPFYSNEEIASAPPGYVPAAVDGNGRTTPPQCCGKEMTHVGDCGQGCCDDYKCEGCGHRVRIEWPD